MRTWRTWNEHLTSSRTPSCGAHSSWGPFSCVCGVSSSSSSSSSAVPEFSFSSGSAAALAARTCGSSSGPGPPRAHRSPGRPGSPASTSSWRSVVHCWPTFDLPRFLALRLVLLPLRHILVVAVTFLWMSLDYISLNCIRIFVGNDSHNS